jgi:hypothetical protein
MQVRTSKSAIPVDFNLSSLHVAIVALAKEHYRLILIVMQPCYSDISHFLLFPKLFILLAPIMQYISVLSKIPLQSFANLASHLCPTVLSVAHSIR